MIEKKGFNFGGGVMTVVVVDLVYSSQARLVSFRRVVISTARKNWCLLTDCKRVKVSECQSLNEKLKVNSIIIYLFPSFWNSYLIYFLFFFTICNAKIYYPFADSLLLSLAHTTIKHKPNENKLRSRHRFYYCSSSFPLVGSS